MGVTIRHTPFYACFGRREEPRRWGALRLFAFFYEEFDLPTVKWK